MRISVLKRTSVEDAECGEKKTTTTTKVKNLFVCEKVVKSTLSNRDIRLSVLEPAGCSAYL